MEEANKFTISNIIIPYGNITKLPDKYVHASGTEILFDLVTNNEIKVTFDHQNSLFSKEESMNFAREETYKITYALALDNKLHIECFPCHTSSWGNSASVERNVTISGKAAIALPINIQLKLNDNLKRLEVVLEFFNHALYYNEKSGKEREVAFWIYYSFEALLVELYGKKQEHRFKAEISRLHIVTDKNFNAFKNTIGMHHRHYKTSYKGDVISIRACINIFRTILTYFIK